MERIKYYFAIIILVLFSNGNCVCAQQSLYPQLNGKNWSRILEENNLKWCPPYAVNLLIQPVHSFDWIYVNPSMTVSRRRVTDISSTDGEQRKKAESQEDFVVQFAFDEPAFIPDFRLTNLRLKDNKYPIATADYFANDIYYKIEYIATSLTSQQTLLCVNVSVKNESDRKREVHVRTNVGYFPENRMFDYHYVPFNWTASRWLSYKGLSMKKNIIYKGNRIIGKVVSDRMKIEWEERRLFADQQYEDALYPQVWYGSGYALPEFRVKDMQNVIHASKELAPGDSTRFSFEALTNDTLVSRSDADALLKMSVETIRSQALGDFEKQFTDHTTSLEFKAGQWSDILTALQLNVLQLLVKYPGKEMYQPTQGGSSERFYVWVFEAVQMLRPMLRTGQFDAVKRSLDYIFALQDAGYPPVGWFTTTQGAIGTTGPRWANTTGMALSLACDYYLYSRDPQFIEQYLPKILRALHWIAGEVKATRKLNSDGTRPLTYGLMPFAVASDGDQGYFVSATDVFSYLGFNKAVQLLESIHHSEAKAMRNELDCYKADLLIVIDHLSRQDGFIDRKIIVKDSDAKEATKFANTDIMAPIATVGIVNPETDIFRRYVSYYEKNVASDYFMGQMDKDIYYIIQCEHYWQPIYLMLGEWKKAFMTAQTCLKYGMTHDTHQTQERFSKRDPAFTPWQPNGSGNGGVIDMILNSLYFEDNGCATLLGAVPFEWLIQNRYTSLKNLHTLTGKVDIEVSAIGNNSCILRLSSDRLLPGKIRIPEYFHPKTANPAIKRLSSGCFKLKRNIKEVVFRLNMNANE